MSDVSQRVERATDTAWHPDRRRVKYFPATRNRDANGKDVLIDNSEWVGDYPILWSRREGGDRFVILLIDMEKGLTMPGRFSEADWQKLPETVIEW